MKTDTAAAIVFLQGFHPEGPWALTAVDPTGKEHIETHTFLPGDECDLSNWVEARNGKRNLYFHVGIVNGRITSKASREDIVRVSWLHVDIDPRAGEDIDEERKRALATLTDPPGDIPHPNIILFSGGGYQGFWRLSKPIETACDLTKAKEAARYNIRLEQSFVGADNCHNTDRIMRLPGTVNLPDDRKKKKGRVPTLATVVHSDTEAYDIGLFTMSSMVQSEEDGFAPRVEISGNVPRLPDVQALDDHGDTKIPDWCKVVIVQGLDPDNPNKFGNSRSHWLFSVCCELVRCGVPDEIIYSVITDPDFSISDSVLDKGSGIEKYAIRQIEQAHEHAIDPWLRKLNSKHAVIGNLGGKCMVIEESYCEALKRDRITYQGFDHFRNRYMNQLVEIGKNKSGDPAYKPAGAWWLEHAHRRQYESLIFAPGREIKGAYNLWKGFGVEARAGDCSLFLDHILNNICGGVQEYYDYLIGWMARAVQYPDRQGEAAVVLRGKQGTGKGIFAKVFGKLWGRHFLPVSNAKHLVGNFNAHLRDCVLLFADEAFYAGDKSHEAILKAIITEDTLTIEAKRVDIEPAPNYLHLIMASNSNWVVPAGKEERRFFVLDVSDEHMQEDKYFIPILEQMETGGHEALLDMLLKYDLTNYKVRSIPQTKALQEQKELSYSSETEWWFIKLLDGRLQESDSEWAGDISRTALQNDYLNYAQTIGVSRRTTATALGKFLRRACPQGWPKQIQKKYANGDRPYYYRFPSLEECREHWDKNYGGPFDWPVYEESEEAEESIF